MDIDTLTPVDGTFIDEVLDKHVSDALFRVQLRNQDGEGLIYVLVKHKSYPEFSGEPMLTINRIRFLSDLNTVARIGMLPNSEGGGRDRRPFSPAEREARRYFTQQAEAADLAVTTDAAANLSARLACGPAGAKTLILGSHLDTVPNGGPYDGALGVLSALEVLRVIAENGVSLPFDLEAIAFTDEEGRFGDFFGSRSLAGSHTDDTLNTFFTRADAYPADLAATSDLIPGGLTRQGVAQAVRDPETVAGYLELHIEQGPRLEHAGMPMGVVSAIFGRSSFKLTFNGRPDHAGTTPMDLRADALVAAAEFVTRAPALVSEDYPDAVITCGGLSVEPGVYNVVPGRVTLLVEFRAATMAELDGIDGALLALASEISSQPRMSHTIERTSHHRPVDMDPARQDAIRRASAMQGYASMDLPSGAGHDAQVMADITPVGMLFVPSKRGRSHCPDEDTDDDDLVAGAEVLLQTVLVLGKEVE